jgi:hypothetical protein
MKTLLAVVLLLARISVGQKTGVPASKSLNELRGRAEKGDAAAQSHLGDLYATGRGVKQQYIEAARWYRKAADQGSLPLNTTSAPCTSMAKGCRRTMRKR